MSIAKFSHVLLDMDGVLADWHYAAAYTLTDHGCTLAADPDNDETRELPVDEIAALTEAFDLEWAKKNPRGPHELVGATVAAMWGCLTDDSGNWWAHIPPTADRFPGIPTPSLFYNELDLLTLSDVTLFSAAPTDTKNSFVRGACLAGKARWIGTHFGAAFDHYILTGSGGMKKRVKGIYRDTLLIDDSPGNCEACVSGGGTAWLFSPKEVSHACSGDARNFGPVVREKLYSLRVGKVN